MEQLIDNTSQERDGALTSEALAPASEPAAPSMSDSATPAPEPAAPKKSKKPNTELVFDIILAVLLALAALSMAWATWMSQLHGSNEAQNYATSAALRAEGTRMSNSASLELAADLTAWNELVSLDFERKAYEKAGNTVSAELCSQRIEYLIYLLADEETEKFVREALAQDPVPNPFTDEVVDSYYAEADEYLQKAEEAIAAGNSDNLLSDSFAFVNVLYSLVLFLLAFISLNKSEIIRRILICASVVVFLLATIYMICLPLPTGFNFGDYLQFLSS